MTRLGPQSNQTAGSGSASKPPDWIPSIVLGVFALLAVQAAGMVAGAWSPPNGTFTGPDSYMRLHRILECAGGSGCPGGVLLRSNAPYGEALHWPWLWDWAILAISSPFRLFLGTRTAATWAAYLVGPMLGVLTIGLLTFAARRFGAARALPYVGLVAAAQPYFGFTFSYARPDHHGLLTALFTWAVLGAAISLKKPRGPWPSLTGVAIGTGIWVSTEGLISALPLIAALGLAWTILGGADRGRANRDVALWAALVALVGVSVDGPAAGLTSIEFDRLSLVHVSLFAVIAGFWGGVTRWERGRSPGRWLRSAATLVGAAAALGLMTLMFPGFVQGPASEIPEFLWTHWLDYTAEYVPLVRRTDATEILMALAPFLFALPVTLWAGVKASGAQRQLWYALAFTLLWFEGLSTFQQVRWSIYVQILSIFPLAWLLGTWLEMAESLGRPLARSVVRVALVALVALAPALTATAIGLLAGTKSYDSIDQCAPGAVIETLATLGSPSGGPATVLAPIFWGPEILYRTDQRVVATPYHRNVDGIVDSHRIMSGTTEDAPQLLRERGISHIVMCPELFWIPVVERGQENSFYRNLVEGIYPSWLRPVETLEDAPGVRILEVSLDSLTGDMVEPANPVAGVPRSLRPADSHLAGR